jgi:hypothetical protein
VAANLQRAAQACILQGLAQLKAELGDLGRHAAAHALAVIASLGDTQGLRRVATVALQELPEVAEPWRAALGNPPA